MSLPSNQFVDEDTLTISVNLLAKTDIIPNIGATGSRFNITYSKYLNGGMQRIEINGTGAYDVDQFDTIIGVKETTNNPVSVNLPLVSSVYDGKFFHIIDEGGNSKRNNITINVSGSDTINGDTDVLINQDYTSISVYSVLSATGWFIF